jgi:hypothetical protein
MRAPPGTEGGSRRAASAWDSRGIMCAIRRRGIATVWSASGRAELEAKAHARQAPKVPTHDPRRGSGEEGAAGGVFRPRLAGRVVVWCGDCKRSHAPKVRG